MHEATVVTDRAAVERRCRDAPPTARVPVEVQVSVADPFDAYRRARRGDGGDAFLETTGGQPGWGYFATDPVDRLTTRPDAAVRDDSPDRGHRADFAEPSPSLSALAGLLDGETVVREEGDVPYPCGAIGWLSYDLARELESLPAGAVDDRGLPHLQVAVYDRIATWEEPRDGETTLRITACPRLDDCGGDPATLHERGVERATELGDAIREGDPDHGPAPVARDDVTFESDCGRAAFADRVRRVKELVREGDTFQTNVSQRLAAPAVVHPVAAYDALRRVNPAPYSCLLEFPGVDLVSASPELLLDVAPRDPAAPDAPRRVRTEPIAGTRPRGATDAADADLETDLTSDEKERAEHAMLVDLERNDLGKVCTYGSVDVAEYRRVDRYSEVMHLVSSVVGDLRPDATTTDAVAATFPGGTITGAPKPRTMEIIDAVERTRRGPYTGSVGIFGFDGRATLNIVIRTLVRQAETYHLRVGAGIVHDSVPDREYDETLDKARALVTAVDAALGERAALEVEE